MTVAEYYANADVRARIIEGCGGSSRTQSTAAYVAVLEPDSVTMPSWDTATRLPMAELESVWDRGGDIARSLWDSHSLVVFLEIDYQNIDAPTEPFLHPAEVFLKLERAYSAASEFFRDLHLPVRAVVTGRGYHFMAEVPLADPVVDALAAIVPGAPAWHATWTARQPIPVSMDLSERQARAAAGLGCLLEYAAHRIAARASASPIPVQFNGTIVGSGLIGRECISIDFSHAGDPLDTRHVRTGFSTYQWHRLRPDIFGACTATVVPPLAIVPRAGRRVMTLLAAGRGLEAAIGAAQHSSMTLRHGASGLRRWLADYAGSPLAAFHRKYYSELAAVTDALQLRDLDALPPCVSGPLRRPNDLLLKPEHIQHVVRGLMARGWTAAQIAHLVRSKYEADHGWGDRWETRMHAQTRAEFDVRVFAGMIATGADALIDFNCTSAQEKDLCPRTGCQFDLRVDHQRLSGRLP